MARDIPLAAQRVIDLARALAIEPAVLMLDEMTAALPANLTERVLEVIGRQRGGDRSVIFISHRMIEIAAVCDRATVLREGETVGVVDVTPGSEEKIVQLMLGEIAGEAPATTAADARKATKRNEELTPRLAVKGPASSTRLQDVAFDLYPGEVLGVVALEGQGQDELFDVLAGSERPSAGEVMVEGQSVSFRHPADAIRAGVVYVAADCAEALLMQRNVRENITLPTSARICRWGPINLELNGNASTTQWRRCRSTRAPAPRSVDSPAVISRRSPLPAGWPAVSIRCSASTQRAVSIFGRRLRYMGCCATCRGRRSNPHLHVRIEGDSAGLRPRHRHIWRPHRCRNAGCRSRRTGTATRGVQPQAGRPDA